ncbi:hemolysin family protein [Pedobacter sp. P351]|uniref:hemolysin family protein n=1 Tax=Pedobacter superstes TaxID=3133441 RepID=UPI0030AB57F7
MAIIIIIFLILLNGVFSMSEIALISSRKFKLESASKKGNKNARKALELAAKPNTFLSTVQIGMTLIGILLGVYSGDKLTDDLQRALDSVPFLNNYSETLAVVLVVIIITYFSIVFGELLPKRIGLKFPEKISALVAIPMHFLSKATKPFIWLLSTTNDLFLKMFGISGNHHGIITEEEIKAIIAESTTVGEILEIEQEIVKRVFALGDRKAGELMTHRSDLTWINIDDDLVEIRRKIDNDPHSVYPVSDNSPDKLVGLVSVSKIFRKSSEPSTFSLTELIEKPVYIQENMAAYRALEKFKEHRTHLIIVVDEYGSVEGVLSITDFVDALMGSAFQQLHEELNIVKRDEHSWLAEGQCPYYEFVNYFQLADLEVPDGFTTLAGLILSRLNNFPVIGERVHWKGFQFEIVDMDEMRIDKVIISKI